MKNWFTLLLLLSMGFCAHAQTKIARAIDARLNHEPNGPKADGGAHDIDCIMNAVYEYDKEIKRVYTKLIKGLPTAERKALIDSQVAWVKFEAIEIKSIRLISIRYGTIHQLEAAQCRLALSQTRLSQLCDRFEQDPSKDELTEDFPEPLDKEN